MGGSRSGGLGFRKGFGVPAKGGGVVCEEEGFDDEGGASGAKFRPLCVLLSRFSVPGFAFPIFRYPRFAGLATTYSPVS